MGHLSQSSAHAGPSEPTPLGQAPQDTPLSFELNATGRVHRCAWREPRAIACRAEHAPGLTLVSGGRERHYLAYVPRSHDGTRSAPAVIDLHGSGSIPEEELMVNGMASEAEREGFVVL